MPLGFAAGITCRPGKLGHIAIKAVGIGAGLSFLIEWLQYYDQSRVSCLSDFYLNAIGSLAGVLVSQMRVSRLHISTLQEGGGAQFARALLFSWIAWRLYPYVPTIDLHKYWNSLKPVVLYPEISAYQAFRYTVLWMGVSHLLRVGVRPKMPPYLVLAVMAVYFCAKVLVVNQSLDLSEMAGAAVALISCCLSRIRYYPAGLALLFAVIVVLSRILPWNVAAAMTSFQWIPFYGFLHGSLTADIPAFFEKLFLYGTLLLLLVEAGLPLIIACVVLCIALLATSALQTLIAGRSAEVTDAVVAVLLAIVYGALGRQSRYGDAMGDRKGRFKAGLLAD
jgi:VanZ family protein